MEPTEEQYLIINALDTLELEKVFFFLNWQRKRSLDFSPKIIKIFCIKEKYDDHIVNFCKIQVFNTRNIISR